MNIRKTSTLIGSGFAALLASSCCWLPFVLVALGISGSAAGALFASFRIPFLVVTVLLLAVAFFFHYRDKKQSCCADEKKSKSRLKQLNEISLWVTAVVVVAVALYPYYHKSQTTQQEETISVENSGSLLNAIDKLEQDASAKSSCCPQ